MGFPPEAFLIGAQKAGTTSLAFLLDQHPQISVSNPKEPDYFTRHYYRGLDWYQSCFEESSRAVCLDASTSYTMLPLHGNASEEDPLVGVPERIYRLNPEAKLIYILRDPVARTYSAYWHSVRNGEEDRPFREAVDDKEESYLWASDYYGQIKNYLRYFPLDAFCFLSFRKLVEDPSGVAMSCFKFLSVNADFDVELEAARNPSYTYSTLGAIVARIFRSRMAGTVSDVVRAVVPEKLESALRGVLTNPIPKMNSDDREFLETYFQDRKAELQKLTGIDLQKW